MLGNVEIVDGGDVEVVVVELVVVEVIVVRVVFC